MLAKSRALPHKILACNSQTYSSFFIDFTHFHLAVDHCCADVLWPYYISPKQQRYSERLYSSPISTHPHLSTAGSPTSKAHELQLTVVPGPEEYQTRLFEHLFSLVREKRTAIWLCVVSIPSSSSTFLLYLNSLDPYFEAYC